MGSNNCDQNCTNTDGGFLCSCLLDGFVLHMNEATCSGLGLYINTMSHTLDYQAHQYEENAAQKTVEL